jgi:hypothetical protein
LRQGQVRAPTDVSQEPFKYVPVFDISQTEGQDIPEICHLLSGDDPAACFSRLVPVAQSVGYRVQLTRLPDGVNGDCSFDLRRIRVEEGNPPAQRVKSLAHEIAHALLHEGQLNRPLAELEAESTAYVVCRSLGLDSGAYSFGYVASWAGGGDEAISGIKASCAAIQRAAAFIADALESGDAGSASEAASVDRWLSLSPERRRTLLGRGPVLVSIGPSEFQV